VKTETTETSGAVRGEVFYDADCSLCANGMRRVSPLFSRYGFRWLPMQTPGTAARLCITESELRTEMMLRRPDGELVRGINTWIFLLRSVWWLRPVALVLQLPGIHVIADHAYRWIARNRYRLAGHCYKPSAPTKHHI
jgi:predicted DCC family thiol-disulfide oxidoreductase YuxK